MAHLPNVSTSILFWQKVSRRLALVFAWLFALFLFGVFLLLLLLLWKRELPVPEFLLEEMHKTLAEENLTATYGKAVFSPPNGLTIEEAHLHSLTTGNPLLEVASVTVRIGMSPGTAGWFSVNSISARGIHIPNATGENPGGPLSDISMSAVHSKTGWLLQHLGFQNENLTVLASGGAWKEIPQTVAIEDKRKWEETLRDLVRKLDVWQASLPDITKGFLTISLTPGEEDSLQAEIEFQANSIQAGNDLSVRRPRLHSVITIGSTDREVPLTVDFSAESITYRKLEAVLEGINGEFLFVELPSAEAPFPREGRLFIKRATLLAIEGESLQADFHHLEEETFGFNGRLLHRGGAITGTGEVDVTERSGRLDLTSNAPLGDLIRTPLVQDFEWSDVITLDDDAPEVHLSLLVGPEWAVKGGSAEVKAQDVIAGAVPLDRVHFIADWDPPYLSVSRAVLQRDDFEAEGSYAMNAETLDFRFLIKGSLRPEHISPWFSPWWSTFWKEFTFHQEPPEGDIDIRGRWNDLEKLGITGSATSRNLEIRGVNVDSLETRYRILANHLDIFNTTLKRPEGEARGEYRQWVHPDTRTWLRSEFTSESSISTEAVSRMLDGLPSSIFSPFSFTAPPRIHVEGTVHPAESTEENRVFFNGKTEHPLLYHGFPLEDLFVQGYTRGTQTDLSELRFGFAEGQVDGNARIDHTHETDRLRFQVAVKEAAFEQALNHVIRFRGSANQGNESDNVMDPTVAGFGGRLDLDLVAEGDLDDLLSYDGQGRFNLRDSDLGKIHLFGLLSRLLSNTPLRFTSFQLSEAESEFQLTKDRLRFPAMRIKGSSVGLEGKGDYLLLDQDLDFRVKIFLLSRSRIPILSLLALPIMDPLGHLLEVRLGGSLKDPNWRFSIDPRNILDGEREPEVERERE